MVRAAHKEKVKARAKQEVASEIAAANEIANSAAGAMKVVQDQHGRLIVNNTNTSTMVATEVQGADTQSILKTAAHRIGQGDSHMPANHGAAADVTAVLK